MTLVLLCSANIHESQRTKYKEHIISLQFETKDANAKKITAESNKS